MKIFVFQELIDSTKTKMSTLAQQYENEVDSGINIEIAKQILREEDQFDKKRFREKIREKHREEKRKLKAKKMKLNHGEEKDASLSNEEVDGNDDVSEDESGEGPDISWLPDPDKIYGKQQNTDEEASSANESTNESEEESLVHR